MRDRPIHVYHRMARKLAAPIEARCGERDVVLCTDEQALWTALPEVRVLYAPRPPREGWSRATELELIQLAGVGVDHFLPAEDLATGVTVAGMRGVFSDDVAEHVLMVLLAMIRGLPRQLEDQAAHRFVQRAVPRLAGRAVTVLGMGAIGERVSERLSALGARVLGVCRNPRAIPPAIEVLGPGSLEDALRRSAALIVTAPLTEATSSMVGEAALRALPRGAHLVHVSRGGVVDEEALRRALEDGHLAGAALDVFVDEPLREDHPLWSVPNLLITPHQAGYTEDYFEGAAERLVENVRRLEAREPLLGVIDRDAGY